MARKGRSQSSSINNVVQAALPPSMVSAFARSTAPTGWLVCDGSAVSRTTYAALFNAIGITHGQGDGSTTFNLPDYRGRFLRGVDGGSGLDPDAAGRTAMATGGNTGNNVGSVQADAFQGHWHSSTSSWYVFSSGSLSALTENFGSGPLRTRDATDGNHGTIRVSTETRAKNANVVWCIKT